MTVNINASQNALKNLVSDIGRFGDNTLKADGNIQAATSNFLGRAVAWLKSFVHTDAARQTNRDIVMNLKLKMGFSGVDDLAKQLVCSRLNNMGQSGTPLTGRQVARVLREVHREMAAAPSRFAPRPFDEKSLSSKAQTILFAHREQVSVFLGNVERQWSDKESYAQSLVRQFDLLFPGAFKQGGPNLSELRELMMAQIRRGMEGLPDSALELRSFGTEELESCLHRALAGLVYSRVFDKDVSPKAANKMLSEQGKDWPMMEKCGDVALKPFDSKGRSAIAWDVDLALGGIYIGSHAKGEHAVRPAFRDFDAGVQLLLNKFQNKTDDYGKALLAYLRGGQYTEAGARRVLGSIEEAKTKPQIQPEAKPKVKPEAKPEAKPEVQSEAQPEYSTTSILTRTDLHKDFKTALERHITGKHGSLQSFLGIRPGDPLDTLLKGGGFGASSTELDRNLRIAAETAAERCYLEDRKIQPPPDPAAGPAVAEFRSAMNHLLTPTLGKDGLVEPEDVLKFLREGTYTLDAAEEYWKEVPDSVSLEEYL